MGITLEEIHAETTDENWQSSFLSSTVGATIVHKLVSLKNLAMYWNSGVKPSQFKSDDHMRKKMADWIHTDTHEQSHQYLLSPISADLKIVLNRDPLPDMNIPKMTLSFVFDQIVLSFSSAQYRDLLDTVEYFQRYSKYSKYNHLRPAVSLSQDPLAYWEFAGMFFPCLQTCPSPHSTPSLVFSSGLEINGGTQATKAMEMVCYAKNATPTLGIY